MARNPVVLCWHNSNSIVNFHSLSEKRFHIPNKAMAEIKPELGEIDSDAEQNYSLGSNVDPKNMQELTIYVSDCRFEVSYLL